MRRDARCGVPSVLTRGWRRRVRRASSRRSARSPTPASGSSRDRHRSTARCGAFSSTPGFRSSASPAWRSIPAPALGRPLPGSVRRTLAPGGGVRAAGAEPGDDAGARGRCSAHRDPAMRASARVARVSGAAALEIHDLARCGTLLRAALRLRRLAARADTNLPRLPTSRPCEDEGLCLLPKIAARARPSGLPSRPARSTSAARPLRPGRRPTRRLVPVLRPCPPPPPRPPTPRSAWLPDSGQRSAVSNGVSELRGRLLRTGAQHLNTLRRSLTADG